MYIIAHKKRKIKGLKEISETLKEISETKSAHKP